MKQFFFICIFSVVSAASFAAQKSEPITYYSCNIAGKITMQQEPCPDGAKAEVKQVLPKQNDMRCHVGKRGGSYTLTKSGKKNYRGC